MSMNFEVLDLRALMAVVELGSFSLAAARLNMSQPALSRRIQKLEALMGGRLLERTTRHVAPSALGQQLLPLLQHALNELDTTIEGMRDLGGPGAGLVTVCCLQTAVPYFIPRVLLRFQEMHPRVRVRVLDMTAQEAMRSVARGECDLAITTPPGEGDAELLVEKLMDDPFVLACRTDHPLARQEAVHWRDLQHHAVIVSARTSINRALINDALQGAGLRLPWTYEVLHMSTALSLVKAGLGVSVMPRLAVPEGQDVDLVARPLRDPVVHRSVAVVMRRSRPLSGPAAQFLSLVREARQPPVP